MMTSYQLFRFYDNPPKTYQEAIQIAIRRFIQEHRCLPASVIVNPGRLAEAQMAMAQINANLVKAGLLKKDGTDEEPGIPLQVVGGCLGWEVGLVIPNGHDGRDENHTDGEENTP